ncbi:hypothetical protein KQI84_11990 [bacterium]|nr:hypothetical protein [bacterium]
MNSLKKIQLWTRISFVLLLLAALTTTARATEPIVLAHYMTWYESEPVSGVWGWHWTMNHFHPPEQAATHDPPLIGLYDSGDPHLLEYHVALMKMAGIDGVVVDWYGTGQFRDYPVIHRNTQRLMTVLKRAGLKLAVCYEDQAVKHAAAERGWSREQTLQQGRADMQWLAENCFADPGYMRLGDRPILLVFGPQYFQASEWKSLTSGIQNRPALFGLPHLIETTGMQGAFGWPPVSGNRTIPPGEWNAYLDSLYARTGSSQPVIGIAFPGFHDIYEQAQLHPSYGYIDPRDGQTMRETWRRAVDSGVPIIQIATWNDFGEGTVIEPTRDLKFAYLQSLSRDLRPDESIGPEQLRLPFGVYRMRKHFPENAAIQEEMQTISNLLLDGQTPAATFRFDRVIQSIKQGS